MTIVDAPPAPPGIPGHLAPVDDEQAVLGACMQSPRALDAAMPSVPGPQVFYWPRHAAVWAAIAALWERGEPADPVQVAAELAATGVPDRHNDLRPYLHTLYEAAPTGAIADPTPYLRRVVDGWKLRAGDGAFIRGRQTIAAPDGGDPDAILDAVAAEVTAARDLGARSDTAVRVGDVVDPLLTGLADDQDEDDHPGVPWPYVDLGGSPGNPHRPGPMNPMQAGQLITIAGRPGMGKSAMLTDCCRHVAFNLGLPALLISYEMKAPEITARIVSQQARVLLSHLTRPGMLDGTDHARIGDYRAALAAAPLLIADGEDTSLAEIDRLIRAHRPRLVAIDYLQLAVPDGPDDLRRARVERYTRSVKRLASRREVPILVGSQLNRASETRRDRTPQLSDLRETGAIEQDSHAVLLIHRPDYYEPEGPRVGEADVIIAKQRNGVTTTVTLANRLHYGSFADLA